LKMVGNRKFFGEHTIGRALGLHQTAPSLFVILYLALLRITCLAAFSPRFSPFLLALANNYPRYLMGIPTILTTVLGHRIRQGEWNARFKKKQRPTRTGSASHYSPNSPRGYSPEAKLQLNAEIELFRRIIPW
jgi:hypothetical protein